MIAGAFGAGNGTTSNSTNIGVVGLTKVGSRRIIIYSSAMLIILAAFSKFGALFTTIPDPVIGGSFIILFGNIICITTFVTNTWRYFNKCLGPRHETAYSYPPPPPPPPPPPCPPPDDNSLIILGLIVAVGISNLQYVNMNSSRNLFVFGFSFFFGLALPVWITDNPGSINTGIIRIYTCMPFLFIT